MKQKSLLLLSLLLVLASSRTVAQVGVPYIWGWGNGLSPSQVTGLSNVVQVSGGAVHSLALKLDGTVWAWGSNQFGQLGNGSTTESQMPIQTPGLANIVQIIASHNHSLALRSDGTVWAWGYNGSGQLGDGTKNNRSSPVQVTGLTNVVQISAGRLHSVALCSDGVLWNWGANDHGQVSVAALTPIQHPSFTDIIQVSAGGSATVVLRANDTVYQWGELTAGGPDASTLRDSFSPWRVVNEDGTGQLTPLTGVVSIAHGIFHTLAIKADGSVYAWGRNSWGETEGAGWQPKRITSLQSGIQVSAAQRYSLMIAPDGSVWGLGLNVDGQLGNGTSTNATKAVQAIGLTRQNVIAAGGSAGTGDHSLSVQAPIQQASVKLSGQIVSYGQPIILVANLTLGSSGFPLANRPLTFSMDGNVIGTAYTLASGNAYLALPNYLNLSPSKLSMSVKSTQDILYSSNTSSATLTIKKAGTALSMGSVSGRPGDTRTIKATLKRKSDGALLSGVPLAFKVDGNAFGTVATDSSGVAVLTFKVDEAYSVGAHTLTVDYSGDANQAASTAKATYNVKQAPGGILGSSVSGKVGATITLKAKLIRKTDNTLLVGKTVRFQIDTVDIGTAVTDGANITTFSYTIPASLSVGTHTLTVLFDGDAFYTSDFNNKSLVVKP